MYKFQKSDLCDSKLPELVTEAVSTSRENSSKRSEVYGPALPSKSFLNIDAKNSQPDDSKSHCVPTNETYGPVLPPSFSCLATESCSSKSGSNFDDSKKSKSYGPLRPPTLSVTETNLENTTKNDKDDVVGPTLPICNLTDSVKSESSDDDEHYGPLPANTTSISKAHVALEERALEMKIEYLQGGKEDHVTREKWMLELPEIRSNKINLGPRQFRSNPLPDFSDRSSWTDTPEDKVKKDLGLDTKTVDLEQEAKLKRQKKYDHDQEKVVKKHKKEKKEKSLVEIHRSSMNKKNKEEPSRRPFSRDIDLKVNHFDDAQKKAILKKAELLNDRFASGNSKYL